MFPNTEISFVGQLTDACLENGKHMRSNYPDFRIAEGKLMVS